MIPATVEQLVYLIMSTLLVIGVTVIAFFVKRGFSGNDTRLRSIDGKLDGLTKELKRESEERIRTFGDLKAEIAAHKAVCAERHGKKFPDE